MRLLNTGITPVTGKYQEKTGKTEKRKKEEKKEERKDRRQLGPIRQIRLCCLLCFLLCFFQREIFFIHLPSTFEYVF